MPSHSASGRQVERQLVAILAADIAGYSRLMGEDEKGTLAQLRACRRELIEPRIAAHHGRVVKTTGDGMLIRFISPVEAVHCAVEMQRDMTGRNADLPDNKRLEFRIGINLGDTIVEDGDIYGDGLNVAARLEALTEPGGICITRAVRDQVRDRVSFAFEDLGQQHVKHIARPLHVYRLCENAETGHPLHDQARDAQQGTDLDTRAVRAAGQGGTANGISESGDTPFRAATGPDVAAGFGASGGSSGFSDRDDVGPPSASLGRLERTAVLFFFMTIVFLAGIFIGASLIANPPTRSSPEAAIHQAGPAAVTPADATVPTAVVAGAPAPAAAPIIATPAPASEAGLGARAQTSTSAAAAGTPPSTVEAASATTTGKASTTGSEPTAAAVASPTPAAAPVEPAPAALSPRAPRAPQALPSEAAPTPKIPPAPRRPAAAATPALLARGDNFLAVGDIVSARLFYERASDAGDGRAALRLGATYDPGFLDRVHLPRHYADAAQALSWYRRARDLGEGGTESWIQGLETNPGRR